MRQLLCTLLMLGAAACRSATEPRSVVEERFGPDALSNYNAYSDSGYPWSAGQTSLRANGLGLQSVLIRKSVTLHDGFVQAVMDSVDDGGLILRFSDNEHYYLLAVRDDQSIPPRNFDNLQIYRRAGAGQAGFVSLWKMNVSWPRGTIHEIGFEVSGDNLRVYFDRVQVASITDVMHLEGGGIGVRHYGDSPTWITRYRRLLWGHR